MRTTLRCWPTEALGSAIGRGAVAPASTGAAAASADFFSAFSAFSPPLQPQPLEQPEPQASPQPQLLQQQLGSAQQLGSQHEPQP